MLANYRIMRKLETSSQTRIQQLASRARLFPANCTVDSTTAWLAGGNKKYEEQEAKKKKDEKKIKNK